jgi:hypothetical protein
MTVLVTGAATAAFIGHHVALATAVHARGEPVSAGKDTSAVKLVRVGRAGGGEFVMMTSQLARNA